VNVKGYVRFSNQTPGRVPLATAAAPLPGREGGRFCLRVETPRKPTSVLYLTTLPMSSGVAPDCPPQVSFCSMWETGWYVQTALLEWNVSAAYINNGTCPPIPLQGLAVVNGMLGLNSSCRYWYMPNCGTGGSPQWIGVSGIYGASSGKLVSSWKNGVGGGNIAGFDLTWDPNPSTAGRQLAFVQTLAGEAQAWITPLTYWFRATPLSGQESLSARIQPCCPESQDQYGERERLA
jgi:hypothetical protein